jgi:AmmeMemoRadiSam system protein A
MCMTESADPLTETEGREALSLARRSLESWVQSRARLKADAFTGGLALPCGAFVTLHTHAGKLRGCIGHMTGDGPVGELIIELGIAAGTQDPRFAPVTAAELPQLTYEVSVLSPMVVTPHADVTPGVHGLHIRCGHNAGVLLPQVATEWGWDREEFLAETCRKAGLGDDAWRQPGTEIRTFTAQVFSEDC